MDLVDIARATRRPKGRWLRQLRVLFWVLMTWWRQADGCADGWRTSVRVNLQSFGFVQSRRWLTTVVLT